MTVLSGPLAAQDGTGIPASEYAARRDTLATRMGEGVVIAFGAPYPVDYDFELRQLPAFDYLTGFREPDAALVLVHADGDVRPFLFTERPTVRSQLYDGFRADHAVVAEWIGGEVRPLGALRAVVDSLASTGLPFHELRDFRSNDSAARDTATRGRLFVDALRARHPDLRIGDLHRAVDAMRARKSPAEVALLRRAVGITDAAHLAALEAIEPGAWEYEIEAAIEHVFRQRGGDGPAYSSIVGSGLNSTVLHYVANDRRMEAGDLILMDIGAAVEGYAADITRTAPVSGTFTADQRAIYDIVLASQKAAEAEVRPGAPAAASLRASIQVRLRGLTELGLIESPDATYDPPWPVDCEARPDQCLQGMLFMIHGISHGIGLEVHDPAQFYYGDRTYQPGDVFTIEPGLYVNADVLELLPDTPRNRAFIAAAGEAIRQYHAIGVRIEDDYLVTEHGVERLSRAPREPEAVEAAMAGEGSGGPRASGATVGPVGATELQAKLRAITDGFAGAVGIYARRLDSRGPGSGAMPGAPGDELAMAADEIYPTASMVKVPLLIGLMEAVDADEITLDTRLVYDDSLFYPSEDDLLNKLRPGESVSVENLAVQMIVRSDNTASLWIQGLVGGADVNEWLASHGFEHTRVNSRVEGRRDDWEVYGWGQSTPREMARLLAMIRDGEAVSEAASEWMYRLLSRSWWPDGATSSIPADVNVAAKPGAVSAARSEALVVDAPGGDYVLVVMTREQEDTRWEYDNAGDALIRDVSGLFWDTWGTMD